MILHLNTRVLICLLILTLPVCAQHNSEPVSRSQQKKWIRSAVKELKNDQTLGELAPAKGTLLDLSDHVMLSYRVQGPARIQCDNGDWIYLLPHSSHDNPDIGDVCLAVTQKGEFYLNYGHICGGIVHYISKKGKTPGQSTDFFNDFIADTDDAPWIRLKKN